MLIQNDSTLEKYQTTEGDKSKHISKIPVNVDEIYEPYLAENTQKMGINDFQILKVLGRGGYGKVKKPIKSITKKKIRAIY